MTNVDKKLIVGSASKEDLGEVADLLSTPTSPRTKDYLLWKFEHTPPNQLSVVKDSSTLKVVGFNALIGWPIVIEENVIDAVQSVDLVVHAEYRNQGIMYDLCSYLYETARNNGIAFGVGWTARYGPAWRVFVKKLGWSDIGLMKVLAYPIRPFRAVRYLKWGKLKSLVAGAFLWLRKLVKHPRSTVQEDLVLEKGKWDYEGLWRCWKDSLNPGVIAAKRNPEFYRRRFSKSIWTPHKFLPIAVRRNDKIVCYAICIAQPSDTGISGVIVDMHSLEGHEVALKLLLNECIEHFEEEGASFVRSWAKKPEWILKLMIDSGFVLQEGKQSFRVLAFSDDVAIDSRIFEFSRWDLDLCDSDHV